MEVLATGANGGQAQIRVPVDVAATGRLRVATNSIMTFYGGSSLMSGGVSQVQDGARLYFPSDSPEHDLTALTGARLMGSGLLQFYGNNQMLMAGDIATTLVLELHDNAQALGPGVLTFETSQTLQGFYGVPIVIANGVSMGVSGAVLTNWVAVQSNAVLYVNYNQVLTVNGALTNRGTLQFYSRDVNTYLSGSGRVENAGLLVVYPVGGNGGQAQIRLPIDVAATGRLLVATNAFMTFYAGSSLVAAGPVEVQDGGRLSFANDSPAHDITLLAGNAIMGPGTLQLNGNNRLVMGGDVTVDLLLQLNDNSVATGPGLLTLRGNQTLTGTYEARVNIAKGASAGISGAVFTNLVTIQSNAVMYVNYNQVLTVNGALTNLGTLQFYSRDVNTYLSGSGRVENAGLLVVYPVGGNGGQAQIRLPMDVAATGRLLVATNAYVTYDAGSFTW